MFSISASITDFPVFSRLETFFRKYKEAGCDGVEIVIGFKQRWRYEYVWSLSQKYNLPITSIHQPPWSGLGIAFDEGFIHQAMKRGVMKFVFHPLTFPPLASHQMTSYFEKIARIQQQYGITVMLENDDGFKGGTILDYIVPKRGDSSDIERIYEIAGQYGFLTTYDMSHTKYAKPHEEKKFLKVFDRIGNIHLSSFNATPKGQHWPLDMGNLDAKGFLQFLKHRQYKGLLTLEVFYPELFGIWRFDFDAIKRSVEIVKSV